MSGLLRGGGLALAVALTSAGCQQREQPPASPQAIQIVRSISPRILGGKERFPARVVVPERSTAPFTIEDMKSGLGVEVALVGAHESPAQIVEGYTAYARAHASGATLFHRSQPDGIEDLLSFEEQPEAARVEYQVHLGTLVQGLRLVANTLELVDAGGAPRLRMAPPYVVAADGAHVEAALAVRGCAVDEDPAPPWGRPVTAPGASNCTISVSWARDSVAYPAVLDPLWTTTGSMSVARQDHAAIVLSTGKVLVAGGRSTSTGTTGLATAELYDPATGTWSATGSMTGGRWFHSAVQLGTSANATTSGKVLVAGGINLRFRH